MKHKLWFPAAVCLSFALFSLYGCREQSSPWSDPQMWYQSPREVNDGYADVFYLVSTDIFHEESSEGSVLYVALNTPEEKDILACEMAYVAEGLFSDSLNFFAPFYHQLTMDAVLLGSKEFHRMSSDVAEEVYESFKYYMENLNDGRPVVLAGFSQGALLVKELLKMMTPEEFSRVAASYVLGWGVNDEDVSTGRVIPAQGPDDTGVCISFNSVADTSAIWPFIMDDCSHSINPVNWTIGAGTADIQYDGQNLTVRLDTLANVLIVNGFQESPLSFAAPWPEGCLHHYEIHFYNRSLNRNILRRVNHFRESGDNGKS